MKTPRSTTRRKVLSTLLAGTPFALAGCLSVKELDDIQAGWDRKHPEGTGIMFSKLPEMIRLLATYEARPVQRAAVQATGMRVYQKMVRQRSRRVTAASLPKRPPSKVPEIFIKPEKPNETISASQLAEAVTTGVVVALPQFIAVEVPKDERFKGKAAVGLWATASQEISGTLIGDFSEKPKTGSVVSAWGGKMAEVGGS